MLLDNNIAEVDADAKPYTPFLGNRALAIDHPALHLGGAAHRIDDARKFRQQAVAGVLYGTTSVLPDLRIDQLREVRLDSLVRTFLIRSHQA